MAFHGAISKGLGEVGFMNAIVIGQADENGKIVMAICLVDETRCQYTSSKFHNGSYRSEVSASESGPLGPRSSAREHAGAEARRTKLQPERHREPGPKSGEMT